MKEFWVGAAALGTAVALLTLGKNYKERATCTEKFKEAESEIEECGVEFIASKKEIECEPVTKSAKAKGKVKNANKKLAANGKDKNSDDVVTVELDESAGNNDGFMFI